MSRIVALLLTAMLAGACASSTRREAGTLATGSTAEVAPALSLERFLRAANAGDLRTMADLFGTEQGSIREAEAPEDVERRMFALASVLKHNDYALKGQQIVPGSLGRAVQLLVMLDSGDRKVTVPFTMVRTHGDAWLVEAIDIDPLIGH